MYSRWAAQLTKSNSRSGSFQAVRLQGTQGQMKLRLFVAHLSSVRVGVKSGRPFFVEFGYV